MKICETEEMIGQGKRLYIFSKKNDHSRKTHVHDFIEIGYVAARGDTAS